MKNRAKILKEKMNSGEFVKGFAVTTADPVFSEMAAYAGYDYIFVDAEHTPLDRHDIYLNVMAAQGAGAAAIVRVRGEDPDYLKGILDLGPDGIIFPFIHSAELAEKAVAACTYPDSTFKGIRGQGPRRAVEYGFGEEVNYLANAELWCLRIMQIESFEGYCNLNNILAVPGVDGIYLGPADLKRSLNSKSENDLPDIEAIINDVYKRVPASGKYLGVPLSTDPNIIKKSISRGAQWGTCGIDTDIMSEGIRKILSCFN